MKAGRRLTGKNFGKKRQHVFYESRQAFDWKECRKKETASTICERSNSIQWVRHNSLKYFQDIFCFHPHPDFMIVGVQKGGTGFLKEQLELHSNVRMAKGFAKTRGRWTQTNETNFFSRFYANGVNSYLAFFAVSPLSYFRRVLGKGELLGEKSADYLSDPAVPERIYGHFPDIKIIILLRNPMERAYSHYRMVARQVAIQRSFDQAVSYAVSAYVDGCDYVFN
jgi:hypothetical protein